MIRAALLAAFLVIAPSCSDDPAGPEPLSDQIEDFEFAWKWVESKYPLFDYKGIDPDEIHGAYRARAEQTGEDDFHDFLDDLLGELRDGHVYYRHPLLGDVAPWTPPRVLRDYDVVSMRVIASYFDSGLHIAGLGRVRYSRTDDNIGYIHLSSLAVSGMMDDFYQVMDYLRTTDGLVLDLRGNLGGIEENVRVLMSRFIESPLANVDAVSLQGPVQLSPYEPDTTRWAYTATMVVLINGACASAPELVAELLQRLPHVTLVGDTTAGAGCWELPLLPGGAELPNSGIIFSVPTAAMLREDGLTWEWNGIVPDVRVIQTGGHIQIGVDPQLEEALRRLR